MAKFEMNRIDVLEEPSHGDIEVKSETNRAETSEKPSHGDSEVKSKINRTEILEGPSSGDSRVHKTTSLPRKTVNLTVFTFDEKQFYSFQQLDRHVTVADILKKMSDQLQLSSILHHQPFSLWMVSDLLEIQLKLCHEPVKLYKKWSQLLSQYTTSTKEQCTSDKPKLFFKRNLFLNLDREKDIVKGGNCSKATTMLCNEAIHNVSKGNYPPLSKDESLELAGYQCAIKSRSQSDSSSIKAKDFLPPHMSVTLSSGKESKIKTRDQVLKGSNLEEELSKSIQDHTDDDDDKLIQTKIKYLEKCWAKDYYGSVTFRALVERKKSSNPMNFIVYRDRPVLVAINTTSLHILNDTTREVMLHLKISHDLSCDFQPATEEGENFYSSVLLEFTTHQEGDKKMKKRLQIFSRQAPLMDAMINRCVCEMKSDRLSRGGGTADAETTITSCSTKDFVCERYECDSTTNAKTKVTLFSSLKNSLKTTPSR